MKRINGTPVLICWSGGIDSTCLIKYYVSKGFNVTGVFFDYGQPSFPGELKAVESLTDYFKIKMEMHSISPSFKGFIDSYEWPLRNANLLISAITAIKFRSGIISMGIHQDSPYYDCSFEFITHMQQIFDGYFNGGIVFDAPFINFVKEDIIQYGKKNNVPMQLTYSCEINPVNPCENCLSCKEREGYVFSKRSL